MPWDKTHGKVKTKVYNSWRGIIQRCTNPRCKAFKYYGARGIFVCKEWMMFENFFNDMGHPPASNYSIERINNDDGYYKSNCKWALARDQYNRRFNRLITFNGVTKNITAWANSTGICSKVIRDRLARGLSTEQALIKKVPIQKITKDKRRFITYGHKTQTLSKWSREVGIKLHTIRQRLELGWSVHDALYTPTKVCITNKVIDETKILKTRNRWITHNGKTLTFNQWAKELHTSPGTLRDRLKDGWSMTKTLSTPVRHKNNS